MQDYSQKVVSGQFGTESVRPIEKFPTRIKGLDEVLFGGIPAGRTTLIVGGPGTGKTIFGLESIYRAALAGEAGVFISFEETSEIIRRNALAFGWDLGPLETRGVLRVVDAQTPTGIVKSGEFDLNGLLVILRAQMEEIGAKRLVIDALDAITRIFPSEEQEDQLISLHTWLLELGYTTVLTAKSSGKGSATRSHMDYLVDCVLRLDQRIAGQVTTRRLHVLKYRGSPFSSNEYPFIVSGDGIVLMPVTSRAVARDQRGERLSTGVDGLDSMLSGGFARGSSALISGSSGTGKTTLAATIASAACERQERVLYVSLEESAQSLVKSMLSAGIHLAPLVDRELLSVLSVLPESRGVEEHLWQILKTIERDAPQYVIVDSIGACRRMGSQEAAFDFLLRLITYCRARGVGCFFLDQTEPGASLQSSSGIGISSLVDALVVLRQQWQNHRFSREVVVLKVRGSNHSHAPHQFYITDRGLEVEAEAAAYPISEGLR